MGLAQLPAFQQQGPQNPVFGIEQQDRQVGQSKSRRKTAAVRPASAFSGLAQPRFSCRSSGVASRKLAASCSAKCSCKRAPEKALEDVSTLLILVI